MKKLQLILLVLITVLMLSACGKQQDVNVNTKLENENDVDADGTMEQEDIESSQETEEVVYDKTGAFLMTVDTAYFIVGHGTVAAGTVERGQLDLNMQLNLVDDSDTLPTTITGIYTVNKPLNIAEEGDHICLRLRSTSRSDLYEGVTVANDKFSMVVEKAFSASEAENDANVYAIGVVESGQVEVGDEAEIIGEGDTRKTSIEGIQTYCEFLEHAEAGDSVLVLLRGIAINQVHEGQTLEQIEE